MSEKIDGYVIREEKQNYILNKGGMLVVFSPILVGDLAQTNPVDMEAFEFVILSPAGEPRTKEKKLSAVEQAFGAFNELTPEDKKQFEASLRKSGEREPDYKAMWEALKTLAHNCEFMQAVQVQAWGKETTSRMIEIEAKPEEGKDENSRN